MTRAPWDLTPPDNPHDRAWIARDTARRIVREVIQDRARTDPGPCGDWCREMVAEEEARKILAMQQAGEQFGRAMGQTYAAVRRLVESITWGATEALREDTEEGHDNGRARRDTDRPADRDPECAPPGAVLDR